MFADAPGKVLKLPIREKPFDLALRLDGAGDPRARELYWIAIEQKDRVADAFCNLGVSHSQSGDSDLAVECFSRSLAENPVHVLAHFNLANHYLQRHDLDLAKLHYEQCVRLDPDLAAAHLNLAWINAAKEMVQPALEAVQQFLSLVPGEEGTQADPLLAWLQGEGRGHVGGSVAAADLAEVRTVIATLRQIEQRSAVVPNEVIKTREQRLIGAAVEYLEKLL